MDKDGTVKTKNHRINHKIECMLIINPPVGKERSRLIIVKRQCLEDEGFIPQCLWLN